MGKNSRSSSWLIVVLACWLLLLLAWCAQASADDDLPITSAIVMVQHGDLNGRNQPDLRSRIEARFVNGSEIQLYAFSGEWAKTIGGEAHYCWVNVRYLQTPDSGEYVVDANGSVRIRQSPSTESKQLGKVRPGQKIGVLGVFGDWAFTDRGWILLEFLKKSEGTKP